MKASMQDTHTVQNRSDPEPASSLRERDPMAYTYQYRVLPFLWTAPCLGLNRRSSKCFSFSETAILSQAIGLCRRFLEMDETLEQAAKRELEEETGVRDVYLEQVRAFSEVDRDPRGRVITIAYFALVKPSAFQVVRIAMRGMPLGFRSDTFPRWPSITTRSSRLPLNRFRIGSSRSRSALNCCRRSSR